MSANPARPAPGAVLALLHDIPDGGARAFDFALGEARFSLLLARRDETVFGYENSCPHTRAPLERPDGFVTVQDGRHLVCAMHGASFDVATGACTGGPAKRALTSLAIRIANGVVRMG